MSMQPRIYSSEEIRAFVQAFEKNSKEEAITQTERDQNCIRIQLIVQSLLLNKDMDVHIKILFFHKVTDWCLFRYLDSKTKKTIFVVRCMLGIEPIVEQISNRHISPEDLVPWLVCRYTKRPEGKVSVQVDGTIRQIKGILATEKEHIEDMLILEKIIELYNESFQNKLSYYSEQSGVEGFTENLDVESGSTVTAVADLHGDLMAFLAFLTFLLSEKCCDKHLVFRKDVQILQLGDLGDRGPNSCEILSIALAMKILNRNNFHVLRGNHEDINTQCMYANDTDKQWLDNHREALTRCYKTFPVTFRIAERGGRSDKGGRKESMLATHGLFSTLVDPFEPEKGEKSYDLICRNPLPTNRLRELCSEEGVSGQETKHCSAAKLIVELQKIERRILQKDSCAVQGFGTPLSSYLWSDVDPSTFFFGVSLRGGGLRVSQNVIRAFLRTGSKQRCDKFLIRGHAHKFAELKDEGKVFGMTLPSAPMGGLMFPSSMNPLFIGMTFTVAPRMKQWRKKPLFLMDMNYVFAEEKDFGMYESLLPPTEPLGTTK